LCRIISASIKHDSSAHLSSHHKCRTSATSGPEHGACEHCLESWDEALPGKFASDQLVSYNPLFRPYTLLNSYRRVQRKDHRMISYRALPLDGLMSYRFVYQLVSWLCRLCIADDTRPSLSQLPDYPHPQIHVSKTTFDTFRGQRE